MTGQIPDTHRYKGRYYSIIALSNPIEFYPENYGFTPVAPHTGCWRGYYCQFDVTEEQLLLSKLWICNGDNPYPEFDGVTPVGDKRERMMVYKDLHHPIDYDGAIVVGSGFLNDYYIHMGFQRAWVFRNVYELDFEHGRMVRKVNHSKTVEEIRRHIDEDPKYVNKFRRGNIVGFIDDSFSLDAKIKAWWI